MPHLVIARYNTSVNSHSLSAYSMSISDTDEKPTGQLKQAGPVFNSVVSYRGVFADKRASLKAVLGFVDASFKVLEITRPSLVGDGQAETRIVLSKKSKSVDFGEFSTVRVLCSKSRNGIYFAGM